jgi:hypothetical protein
MPGILQEKFQVDNPQEANDDNEERGWIPDREARVKKLMPGREGYIGGDAESTYMNNAVLFNSLPPGMDLEDQEVTDQREFKFSMGGETDISSHYTRESEKTGFMRLQMRATDDEYSKAHVDAFYDEIDVDGNIGFTERNNMLDRL